MTLPVTQAEIWAELSNRWTPLPDKPNETALSTFAALRKIAGEDEPRLLELVRRRLDGVPLSHLTGRQTFMGIEMLAGPEALIPRAETEIVCKGALDTLNGPNEARIMDMCCGAGNLGLSLAWHKADCRVWGADISPEAVGLANRNAVFLGLQERVRFTAGDLFAPFETAEFAASFDLVICNPPYISSARVEKMPREIAGYEPRLAFDGGPFGVKILTRLIRETPRFLKPGGWLAFEVGLGQGKSIQKMLENATVYDVVETLADQSGEIRALRARAAAASV